MNLAVHPIGLSPSHDNPKYGFKISTHTYDRTNSEDKIVEIPSELLQPKKLPVDDSEHHLAFDLQKNEEMTKFLTRFWKNSILARSNDTLNQNSFLRWESSDYGAYENDALKLERELFFNLQKTSLGSRPFVFLENAKSLLNAQRIQDARDTLQRGADLHPNDTKIAHLLRAISPGRVTKVKGTAPNRSREVAWIRRHGDKYRGQWVAVSGDDLLATAKSLNKLLEKINRRNDKGDSPLVHYFVPN